MRDRNVLGRHGKPQQLSPLRIGSLKATGPAEFGLCPHQTARCIGQAPMDSWEVCTRQGTRVTGYDTPPACLCVSRPAIWHNCHGWQLARTAQQARSPMLHSHINFIQVVIFLCISDDGPERWQGTTGHIHMDAPLLPLYTCTCPGLRLLCLYLSFEDRIEPCRRQIVWSLEQIIVEDDRLTINPVFTTSAALTALTSSPQVTSMAEYDGE